MVPEAEGAPAVEFDGERTDSRRGPPRIRPVGQSRACLILVAGHFPGETYILQPSTELTIGRGPGNDIRLAYTDISRLHAKARCSASGKVEVTDLGSTNGTYVNGRKQLYRVLREGDKLQFGEHALFRFAFHDEVDEEFQARLFGVPFLDRASNTLKRERFASDLAKARDTAGAEGVGTGVVAMTIDGFDLLEEILGIAVRDYFLRELGWIIRKAVAGEATLYRVDHAAFATLLVGSTPERTLDAAERIRRAVAGARLTHQGDQMAFSLAVGVATAAPGDTLEAEDLLQVAIDRSRAANAAGGDRVLSAAPAAP